ncbi:MAG TPA: hypothetical protein VII95_00775, partial [Terriglobales bacterium]
SAGAAAEPAASQGLRVTELVASSWKLNFELSLGESAEYCPKRSGTSVYLYVEDVDAVYKRALEAGAKPVQGPANQAYGDRSGGVEDSLGNQWWVGTHIEDVSSEEIERRYSEMAKQQAAGADKSK